MAKKRKNEICGIYKIENKINKKIYIGLSKAIYKRWDDHKYYLRHHKHQNTHLQRAWDKYGEDNFEFSVVEEVPEENLEETERKYISMYKSNDYDKGYNNSDGGERCKWNEETIKKRNEACEKYYKAVYQLDENGNIINEYKSLQSTNQDGFNPSLVLACVKKHRRSHKGFIWIYKDEYDEKGVDLQDYKHKEGNRKEIIVLDDGRIFKSAVELEEKSLELYGVKLYRKGISKSCTGYRKTYKGFTIRFK